MPYRYAHEKFTMAVHHLATAPGRIQERLLGAWQDQGQRIPVVEGGETYPGLAQEIEDLHDLLCFVGDGYGQTRIANTEKVLSMSESEATHAAEQVLRLAGQLDELART
jgi:hypothetical protein